MILQIWNEGKELELLACHYQCRKVAFVHLVSTHQIWNRPPNRGPLTQAFGHSVFKAVDLEVLTSQASSQPSLNTALYVKVGGGEVYHWSHCERLELVDHSESDDNMLKWIRKPPKWIAKCVIVNFLFMIKHI